MESSLEAKRELLRHLVATVAFRGGVAVAGARADFGEFRAGDATRTAGEILAHLGDLLEGTRYLCEGRFVMLQSPPRAWDEDVARFFAAVKALDDYLASDRQLAHKTEKLMQGPLADALTHVGQIVMLRRLAGAPIRAEKYFTVEIAAGALDEEYFARRDGAEKE